MPTTHHPPASKRTRVRPCGRGKLLAPIRAASTRPNEPNPTGWHAQNGRGRPDKTNPTHSTNRTQPGGTPRMGVVVPTKPTQPTRPIEPGVPVAESSTPHSSSRSPTSHRSPLRFQTNCHDRRPPHPDPMKMGNLGATGRLRPVSWMPARTLSRGHFQRNLSPRAQSNPAPRSRSTTLPAQTPRKTAPGFMPSVLVDTSRLRTSHQVQLPRKNEVHGAQFPVKSELPSIPRIPVSESSTPRTNRTQHHSGESGQDLPSPQPPARPTHQPPRFPPPISCAVHRITCAVPLQPRKPRFFFPPEALLR